MKVPVAPLLVLFHVPVKRYAPVPVVCDFDVSTVPVQVALPPAVPLNVVPLTRLPDNGPGPFWLEV